MNDDDAAQRTPAAHAPQDVQLQQPQQRQLHSTSTKTKTKGGRRKRSRHPMNKLARQRSVEFNLSLDINNLRQEVQNLLQLREILATKALVTRTSPTGSLTQMVREFYAQLHSECRPRARDGEHGNRNLAEFLPTMMHDDVNCYDGFTGHETILTQFRKFAGYMELLGIFLEQLEITESHGDEAMVKVCASGITRVRLVRKTLVAVFPHILAHEELSSHLAGQIIDFPGAIQFIFNSDGKVCEFRVELDLIAGLSATLGPEDIALVLGNARIAHSMICIDDEPEDIDGAFEGTDGESTTEEHDDKPATTVFSDELMGELPSLFALDESDEEPAFECVNTRVLSIDVGDLFHF